MTSYKHTQIGYLMLVVLLAVLVLFARMQIIARAEPPSYNSGTNFAVTAVMALILLTLASFTMLSVSVDENYIRIKFGWGIFRKKFAAGDIASVARVKNHWYYGWGIRLWWWPRMWIFNISGFDAVEIRMKNPASANLPAGKAGASAGRGKIYPHTITGVGVYRIGTDEPEKLEAAIRAVLK